jgi:hypothetical protein
MAKVSAPTPGIDAHLLESALLKFGVTPGGAHQFTQGLPVSSPADRGTLRATLLSLVKPPGARASPNDSHLLQSALLFFSVTPAGAQQFMQGLPVGSQADRAALRAMFLGLTQAPATPSSGRLDYFLNLRGIKGEDQDD